MIGRTLLVVGAILAGLAVALGAFAAHALRERLTVAELLTFETAVRYQMYHAIGLMLIGASGKRLAAPWRGRAALAFFLGILCFSGSLYWIATMGASKPIVYVTPLGGILFLLGWAMVSVAAWQAGGGDGA